MPDDRQLCTFYLADRHLGVEVGEVREVLGPLPVTRVPLAHPVVRGLLNLRGRIVTAIDLRRRLGLPDGPPDRPPVNLVVAAGDGLVSLQVDEIGDLVPAPAAALERPPDTLTGPARELVRGVYKLDVGLVLLLDTARAAALPPDRPTNGDA